MNREQRRKTAKGLKKIDSKYTDKLVEVDLSTTKLRPPTLERAWRSNRLGVLQHRPPSKQAAEMLECRLSISLTSNGNVGGITHDEMQSVLQQCGWGEREAIEAYSREKDLAYVRQEHGAERHLWVIKGVLPFMWRQPAIVSGEAPAEG